MGMLRKTFLQIPAAKKNSYKEESAQPPPSPYK